MSAVQAFKNIRLTNRFKFRNRESCESKLINKANNTESVISTVNLSPTGIAFLNHSKQILKVGDTAMIELSPFGSPPIRSFVRIVRAEQVAGTILYGAQFIALPLLHRERLDKMIRSAQFSMETDEYIDSQDLKIRLSVLRVMKQTASLAAVLAAMFVATRILNIWLSAS